MNANRGTASFFDGAGCMNNPEALHKVTYSVVE